MTPFLTPRLDWSTIATTYRVLSARDVLAMRRLPLREAVTAWLRPDAPPLALVFVSHRWRSDDHPDPDREDVAALQRFLKLVFTTTEAMLLGRDRRLELMPALDAEGVLQAAELSRRILGFGPFADESPHADGGRGRALVRTAFDAAPSSEAFQEWLAERIGVWIDYTCMPQGPLIALDPEFGGAMQRLGSLVMSSTVVALRHAGDLYDTRGWCAMEYFLGSSRSFARSLFVDVDRLAKGAPIPIPPPPQLVKGVPSGLANVTVDGYRGDLDAYREACDAWESTESALVEVGPPDAWSCYRSLQTSGSHGVDNDPNPFRRALELVRGLEAMLVETWLMRSESVTIDFAETIRQRFAETNLACANSLDIPYLGCLLGAHGWVDAFRPLFQACVERAALRRPVPLRIRLEPLGGADRALFREVDHDSADAWHSRLWTRSGSRAEERGVIERLRRALEERPPRFTLLDVTR